MQPSSAYSPDGRQRFAAALQTALTLDEVGQVFLRCAGQVIHTGAFGLYHLDEESGGVLRVLVRTETDFLEDYEEYGRADDPVLRFVVEQRRPIDSSRVVTEAEWQQCGARAALGIGGYGHSLEAPVLVAGTLFGTINFARLPGDPEFSEADLISARLAGEQLGLATERALRFESTGQRATMLENVLNRVPQALIVTDLDAQVLFRNRVAVNELGRRMAGGRTSSTPDPIDETIREAMTEFRLHGKRVHTASVRDHRTDQQVIVKSYRLADSHNAAVTLMFTCGQEQGDRLPAWDVLSPREQEIAQLVSEGLTTKQIAERAYISENTVKQHLKRVFAKTDVRNRAELVQLIWAAGGEQAAGSAS